MNVPIKPDIQHYSFDGRIFLIKVPAIHLNNTLIIEVSDNFLFQENILQYIMYRKNDDINFFYANIEFKYHPFVFKIGNKSIIRDDRNSGGAIETITTWSDTHVFRRRF